MIKIKGGFGRIASGKSITYFMNEIRRWLDKLEVNGLDIDIKYDARTNIALIRFSYKGKWYEFRSTAQEDVRKNMGALAYLLWTKARLHFMHIEDFASHSQEYLRLEAPQGYQEPELQPEYKASAKAYVILGVSDIASNTEIEKAYIGLCKRYHPDMALSEELKQEITKKMAEINQAYTEIKKERGIQ